MNAIVPCRPRLLNPSFTRLPAGRPGLWLLLCGWLLTGDLQAGGTWAPLASGPPVGVNNSLLLTDGTVLGMNGNGQCVKLTPDSHGSYVNGTWTSLPTMNNSRMFFASQLLTNGTVFVAGGEYGSGGSSAEIYDPVNNVWNVIPCGLGLGDAISKLLPNGNPLVGPANDGGDCFIYSVVSNSWSAAGNAYGGQDEAEWVKLPGDNIVTIDIGSQNSEHYVPALNQWFVDGNVPVPLYGYGAELGAGFLLPNGTVFYIGGTTNTAIYTPGPTATSAGSWVAGPGMPNNLGAVDAPAAMLVNGRVLCDLGPVTGFNGPCSFYEYDYLANTFTLVSAPGGGTSYDSVPYANSMLDLPDGTVLFIGGQNSGSLYVYTPDGTPLPAGQPVINRLTQNQNGSYHLTGTGLNGISEGAAYGDDEQMNGNYPLVRLTNVFTGMVYYARTYNFSSTSVMTGSRVLTTEFSLPPNFPPGTYSLVVVAVGNPSAPQTFIYAPGGVPTGLAGTAGNAQASLSWNPVSGATAYNLKRLSATSPPYYATVATVTGTNFTTAGLVNGLNYFFAVSAVSPGGESTNSPAVVLTPVGPPPVPANLTATPATFARIALAWTPSYGATSYTIKRAPLLTGTYTNLAVSLNPFYTDFGLVSGATCYYEVAAVSRQGSSSYSPAASASAQSVANGGFEYPNIGANYQYVPASACWTFSGTNGNGAGILGNGSGFSNPNAPEGTQAAFVQSNGVLSQVISGFVPGTTYAIIYSAAQRAGSSQNGGESWNVTIDNKVIQSNAPGGTSYADYTATFVATAPTHTLAFVGTDLAGGDNTVFLDNVRVTLVPPVIANYSFEVPNIGGGNYQYNPAGASWIFTGASPNGSGLVANGSGFSNPNAPLGGQSAFVQEHGTISQTITGFKPGTNYVLAYAAAQRPGNSQSWNVLIDSTVIQTNSPGGTSFATCTAVFKATATSHKLTFQGTDLATGDNTVFIDDVSITSPPQPAAPLVTLITPTNSAFYTIPASINLTASVVTNGNLISSVQFYENGTNLIGQAGGPPYSYNWINPDTGNYNVFARVTYNGGSVMDSPAASLTVVSANVNFSFEYPSLGYGNFQYNPAGGAWAFGGSSGNGSGIVANGSPFGNPSAPLGTQAAFVQGYGTLAQTLAGFAPGVTYTLTFLAAQRGSVENGGESWNVLLDNNYVTNFPPGGTGYAPYSATFTATAAIHTLSFVGTDLAGGDNTVFLDNFQIVPPIPPVVPVIALTAPANNAASLAPATLNLAATVTANNNQINSVGFYFDTTNLIAQVTNPPYFYAWNNVGAGSYRLQARVNYNNLSSVTSPAVNVTVTNPPPPVPWMDADIGSVGLAGSAGWLAGVFTVTGSGTGLSGPADGFNYVYQKITGNCDLRARVAGVSNPSPGAQAGVMLRETLDPGSASALLDVTPGNGLEFIWRATPGNLAAAVDVPGLGAPYWVRLVRNLNTFTAYASPDGANWSKIGTSQSILMATNIFAGLAVCAQNNAVLATGTFDNAALSAPPSDVYNPPPLTASLAADGVFTLQFPGVNDLNYVVETSTNLTGWTAIFTNALTAADAGRFIYTNPNATEPARFYRVSQ